MKGDTLLVHVQVGWRPLARDQRVIREKRVGAVSWRESVQRSTVIYGKAAQECCYKDVVELSLEAVKHLIYSLHSFMTLDVVFYHSESNLWYALHLQVKNNEKQWEKFLSNKLLTLITSGLVIFVALRIGLKIFG